MERLPTTAPGIIIRDFPEKVTLSRILERKKGKRLGRYCRHRRMHGTLWRTEEQESGVRWHVWAALVRSPQWKNTRGQDVYATQRECRHKPGQEEPKGVSPCRRRCVSHWGKPKEPTSEPQPHRSWLDAQRNGLRGCCCCFYFFYFLSFFFYKIYQVTLIQRSCLKGTA